MTPFGKNEKKICSKRIHDDTDSRSNFTEIVRREIDERMRCFGDKKVLKMRFFRRLFAPVWRKAPNVYT